MSTALDFTRDINQLPTKDQAPRRMQVGGMASPAQMDRDNMTESTKMLAEAPPESLDTRFKDLLYRQTEEQPEEFTKENPVFRYDENSIPQTVEPPRPKMNPQLQQILQAQNDMTGPMALLQASAQPKEPESGLARLIANLPTEYNV